ncbi:hypothetical protein KX928_17375 [Roseobacter sp. YSTF-M11]|uniref:Uncharacterized protein n=1 Tax=Roseobacter insulae TaxID=2859783 RepID=A0A9X1JZR2_9RHOB|nr:hypothetical protein [Roseobacter insulae]MBW4709560.1 hypothetical protein [Roseobacter insulae]
MRNFNFRAWGDANWLLPQFQCNNDWAVLACVGTEQRSVESALELSRYAKRLFLAQIDDPYPQDPVATHLEVAKAWKKIEEHIPGQYIKFVGELKSSLDEVADYAEAAVGASRNIVLDITSFPKRWFFPMVQLLLNDQRVENLVVVYTQGTKYAKVISRNPEALRPIQGFPSVSGRSEHDFAFVGVGFHLLNFSRMFGEDRPRALKMLFPFPPGPPGLKRNWKFVESMERIVGRENDGLRKIDPIDFIQLSALDVSQAFDAMRKVTKDGERTSYMLPFGPKPVSLAMCLFSVAADQAEKSEVPIYYAQPSQYALHYTKEPLLKNGRLSCLSYALKHAGRLLYSV